MTSELVIIQPSVKAKDLSELEEIFLQRARLIKSMIRLTNQIDGVGELEDASEVLDLASTEFLMIGQALELTYKREQRLRVRVSDLLSTQSQLVLDKPGTPRTPPNGQPIQASETDE